MSPRPSPVKKKRATASASNVASSGTSSRATKSAVETPRIARLAKGKKPQYFSDPAIDKLLWMTLTLMEELSVTRDRLDTVERLLSQRQILKLAEIDRYKPDPRAAASRAARRSDYVERMMRAVHAELEGIAGRDMPKNDEEVVAAVES